jgi:hypothetical protein
VRVFFFFFAAPFSFFLSFFLFDRKHNPHIPPIRLYHSKIKIVFFKVDNLHLSSTTTIFLKRRKNSLASNLQTLTLDLKKLNCPNKKFFHTNK